MASIELYAELLINIRQVTVFATLPSIPNNSTGLELSADRKYLFVLHDGARAALELPCQVADNATLDLPASKLKELSFRLRVAHSLQVEIDGSELQGEDTIWPASILTFRTKVACQACRNIVVKDTVSTWKDLPSENWAEMMDFWHCHKPDVEAAKVSSSGSTKGYAASNVLTPVPGVALVDTLHLRLANGDCVDIEVSFARSIHQSERHTQSSEPRGNKKEVCLHILSDQWHIRRYNYPRVKPM